jgi:predicted Zn-dependent peptidase
MRILTFTALAIALAAPLHAQSAKPAPLAPLVKKLDVPYKQFTLKNGLRVIVHTDRKAPVVAVAVWYDVGSKHEPAGKTGFAHLFEHLMFGGSENVPDFDKTVTALGASNNNGSTWFDRTNYFQNVPTAALDRMLYVESDRMGWLLGAVTQETLDAQRGVVQNEKRQGDNQPYGLVEYAQLAALLPPGHPYAHSTIGSMADLQNASMEDVRGWFRQHYGPNNAVLVLAGDIDVKTAKPKVERWFGSIARGPQQAKMVVPVPTLSAPKQEVMKDNVANVRIHRQWAVPGEDSTDATPLSVAGAVLGGLASSRLDNALVRGEQLAVSVTAGYQGFAQLGFFEVTADVKPGVDPALVNARLDAIIGDFIKTGPTPDELERVVARTVSGQLAGLEQVGGFGGKATLLAEGALYRNDPADYRKQVKALVKITPAQVKDAIARWLTRPAYDLRVEPGERAAYQEPQGNPPPPTATALEKAPRPPMPDMGDGGQLSFPAIERATLSNGIPVFLARRSTMPRVQVSVSFDAGYAADPKAALGTQSLMLSLMPEGTTSRSSLQIAEDSERLGAGISTGAGMDRTSFGLSALTPNLGASLDLLADIVRNPAFAPDEVERIRAQQLNRIASELTQPGGLAGRVMPQVIWGKAHPYAIPGSGSGDATVVKALSPAALHAFHKAWLRPDNARIFVAGDTSLKQIVPLLEARFGQWTPEAGPKPAKDFSAAIPKPQPRIILVDRPNSPQSYIMGATVLNASGRDDLVTLRAANEVFGVGLLSRINQDLRETKGWSYGVRSGIGGAEERVSFSITAPVQADRTGDSIKALRAHLSDFLGPKGVTPEELERTIESNVRELPGSFETTGAVLGGMTSIVNLGRPDDYYQNLGKKYAGLTAPTLDATARAKIDPASLVWVVVGDARTVRPQLDGIGLPVEDWPSTKAQ